jgi:hypothetical protein
MFTIIVTFFLNQWLNSIKKVTDPILKFFLSERKAFGPDKTAASPRMRLLLQL